MADKLNGFYSYIEENNHHDAWRIMALVFILAIIGLLTWFLSGSDKSQSISTNTEPISPSVELTDADRFELLNKPSSIPLTNPDMTDAERIKLINGNPPKAPMLK